MKRSDKSCGALNGAKHFLQLIWFCRQEKISFETQHSIGSAKAAFAITGTEYDILQMQPPELSRSFCRRRHLNFDRKASVVVYFDSLQQGRAAVSSLSIPVSCSKNPYRLCFQPPESINKGD